MITRFQDEEKCCVLGEDLLTSATGISNVMDA